MKPEQSEGGGQLTAPFTPRLTHNPVTRKLRGGEQARGELFLEVKSTDVVIHSHVHRGRHVDVASHVDVAFSFLPPL